MTVKKGVYLLSHPIWSDKRKYLGQEVIGVVYDY